MEYHPDRRSFVTALASFSILIAACAGAGAPAETTAAEDVCPTCPPPIVITVAAPPTPSTAPSPTPTPTPTVVLLPTRIPLLRVHKCVGFSHGLPWTWIKPPYPIHYTWCVLNIKFNQDGFMMVDVYYSGNAGDSNRTVNLPPGGVANIYALDDLDNKYGTTKRGGCAQTPASTSSGKGCSGWLIYPVAARRATMLSFFDDMYGISITNISLVGDSAEATATLAP